MINRTFAQIALGVALALLPASLIAQTYGQDHDINGRRANEQERIQQGERSGQVTPREANNLERHQANIHRSEERMRARDGGRLTRRDRQRLARRQNRQSRHVYRDKHNYRTDGVYPR